MMKTHFLNYKLLLLLSVAAITQGSAQQKETEVITLGKAVDLALQNNNLLRVKQLQVAEQQAKMNEKRVNYFPAVTVNGSYLYNAEVGQLVIPAGTFGSLPLGPAAVISLPNEEKRFDVSKHQTFMAGASLYQPITQLGKIKKGVDVARTDYSIAVTEQTKARQQITNAVEQLYYGVLVVRKQKEQAQKKTEVAHLNLYDVQSARLSGKTTGANEAGLNAAVASEEQELLKLKFREEDYLADLKSLTGISATDITLAEENNDTFLTLSLQEYQALAEKNNPDIQLTSLQKQKSELAIQANQWNYLPDVGLVAGYLYQEGNSIMPKSNPYAGASLKWNIQETFSNRQVLNQRKIVQQQALENETYTRKQTTVAVEKAYRKMKQAEELISVAQKAVNYRREEMKIEADRKETGLGRPVKLLETQAGLAGAEADLYAAQLSYKVAVAELRMLTEPVK